MKRLPLLFLLLLTLTACAAPQPEAVPAFAPAPSPSDSAALGIGAAAHLRGSMHATEAFPGYAQLEVTVAAVLVDGEGVIRQCRIDGVRARLPFDHTGTRLPADAFFPSKAALGQSYGMHKASTLGTEWYQQAERFAQSCVGKTADELRGTADTLTSVTVSDHDLRQAVLSAAEQARPTHDLRCGDTLTLTCCAVSAPGRSAAEDGCGRVSLRFFAAARVLRRDTAVGESHTALAAHVPFDARGRILCDCGVLPAPGSSVLYPTGVTAAQQRFLQELQQES